MRQYGSEEQCTAALERLRWPQGLRCPQCAGSRCPRIPLSTRVLMQFAACRHQASPTAGKRMDSSRLPFSTWFLATQRISQARTGLCALALMRQLGVCCRSAWRPHHKAVEAMAEADARHPPSGDSLLDEAWLGGEKPGSDVCGDGTPARCAGWHADHGRGAR